MKRVLTAAITIVLLLFIIGNSFAQTPDTILAKRFIELNNRGKFEEARAMFAPSIQPQLGKDILREAWEQFNHQFGRYIRIANMEVVRADTFRHVRTICDFEKADVTFSFTFSASSHELYGFIIEGVKNKGEKAGKPVPLANAHSIDTSVAVDGGKIYGTLLIPDEEKKYPVVLIIAGSGPTDRNGNSTLGEQSNMYLMLADSLAAYGIASFRYDKRYLGESTDFLPSDISHISFDDYVNDAVDIIRFLQKDPEFSKVIIAGHSEGSLIGMIAAQKTKVDAYISLSGMGENFGKILEWQLDQQPGINKDTVKNILDKISRGQMVENVPSSLQTLFLPYLQHYMFTEMKYDPVQEIKKLHIPVLIVNGTTDLQITVKQAELLHQAKPNAELAIIPGMNHILKDAPEDRAENLATYNNPDLSLNNTLVEKMIRFIKGPSKN
jgi:pimeloyl-ACP methyl ester carboxylesterase